MIYFFVILMFLTSCCLDSYLKKAFVSNDFFVILMFLTSCCLDSYLKKAFVSNDFFVILMFLTSCCSDSYLKKAFVSNDLFLRVLLLSLGMWWFVLDPCFVLWFLVSFLVYLAKEERGESWLIYINYIMAICVLCLFLRVRERNGSVVECLTRDREAAGSSLTGVTAVWSLSKTHLS